MSGGRLTTAVATMCYQLVKRRAACSVAENVIREVACEREEI